MFICVLVVPAFVCVMVRVLTPETLIGSFTAKRKADLLAAQSMKIYVLSVTSSGLMRHQMAELFLVSISDPLAQGNTQLFCREDGDDENHFFKASKD